MPKNPCEVRLHLIDQLALRAKRITSAANRIHELIAADGNVTPLESATQMKSLRIELAMHMEDWERGHEEIQKHRAAHGC